ncbi:hypothetical protein Tco_1202901 [Tanacetum coccineum]
MKTEEVQEFTARSPVRSLGNMISMKNEGTKEVHEGTEEVQESTARRYCSKVLNAHIRYHLKELRYCAQCLIIENEDFVKRSRDHYMEPTEFEIQEMGKKIRDLQLIILCGGMFKEILSQGEALKIVSFMETVFLGNMISMKNEGTKEVHEGTEEVQESTARSDHYMEPTEFLRIQEMENHMGFSLAAKYFLLFSKRLLK